MEIFADLLRWGPVVGLVALTVWGASRTTGGVRARLMIGGALLVGADMLSAIHGALIPLYTSGQNPGLLAVFMLMSLLRTVLVPAGVLMLMLAAIEGQRQRSAR